MDEILYLKHHNIDKIKWDNCINSSPDGQPYALSWYLDVVSPRWQAFIIKDKKENYKYVLPLPVLKQYGIFYLKQPFFCQQLGVFADSSKVEDQILQKFLLKIKRTYSYSIDYTFNSGNAFGYLREDVFLTSTRYLDLSKEYNKIFENYRGIRKVNLKRAQKSGLKVVEGQEIEPLIKLFKEYTANKIYGGVSESTYDIVNNLFQDLKRKKCGLLYYTIDPNGNILAGSLFVKWRNRIIYLFSSSSLEGKKKNGMTLIIDNLIRSHSGSNFILDFESPSSGENEGEGGIALFSSSFGAVKSEIPQLIYNNLPIVIKALKTVKTTIYKLIKG